MKPMNTYFNSIENDEFYLTMKDWFDNDYACVQKWLYEVMFYKKSAFRVTTDPVYGDPEVLYHFGYVNKFNCGPRRKRKLLLFYGHKFVDVRFRNGKRVTMLLYHMLCIYGWKYILNNVQDIVSAETGELLFYTMI